MKTLAIQDLAIGRAIQSDTLRLRPFVSRPIYASTGELMIEPTAYVAVEDDHGLIELADSMDDAERRVAEIKARLQ